MPTNTAPDVARGSSAPRPPYRLATMLAWGAAASVAGAPALGQTITTVPMAAPATVAPVPTGGFWMLALLIGVLAAAGIWAIRSGRAHRAARLLCALAVLAAGLMIAGYNPAVRAALAPSMPSFTQAGGETMDIPILPYPAEGEPTDFTPVEFTNASGARLKIARITPPASPAVCFPSGIPGNLPATPLPEGVPACAVDLPLDRHAICAVNVAAMCAQGLATISVSPQSLAFAANGTGTFTVTASPASPLAAKDVVAVIPSGSDLYVHQSTSCPASLAPGASCTITLTSATAEASTDIAIAGANTNAVAAAVTVTAAPIDTYTVSGTIAGTNGCLALQNNGADTLFRDSNGSFTFPTSVATGSAYNVTVLEQPPGQTCSVSQGSGTMGAANVTNVAVDCTPPPASLPLAKNQGWGC